MKNTQTKACVELFEGIRSHFCPPICCIIFALILSAYSFRISDLRIWQDTCYGNSLMCIKL